MEIWKPIAGFELLYEVSNFGNVRRIARAKKLDPSKIDAAKQMFVDGATLKQVAEFLQTSIPTAHSIKLGKTWSGQPQYRPLNLCLSKNYLMANLCKEGKYYKKSVHRLVWEAFNGPIGKGMEINHKDLDRANNRIENLEVVTHQQNIQHAIDKYAERGLLRAVKGVKGFIAGKHSAYDN